MIVIPAEDVHISGIASDNDIAAYLLSIDIDDVVWLIPSVELMPTRPPLVWVKLLKALEAFVDRKLLGRALMASIAF